MRICPASCLLLTIGIASAGCGSSGQTVGLHDRVGGTVRCNRLLERAEGGVIHNDGSVSGISLRFLSGIAAACALARTTDTVAALETMLGRCGRLPAAGNSLHDEPIPGVVDKQLRCLRRMLQ